MLNDRPHCGKVKSSPISFGPTDKKWLCQTTNITVQAKYFANNFGLYINSQRKNQYGRLHTLYMYTYSRVQAYLSGRIDKRSIGQNSVSQCEH